MPDPTPSATSPFVAEIAPIDCSDDEIRRFLADAELQPLLPALAYATGEMSLLRDDLRPDPLLLALPAGGFTDEQAVTIRALALDTLVAFRDGGCVPAAPPTDADVLRIMSHAVGGFDVADYLPLLEEELSHRGEDRRGPTWHKDDVAPDADFRVLVVGAGMSGLLAGHRLAQAGVDFLIVEKNDDVGGTWYENSYPGCRVDNPNHNFSYSFAQRHDWPYHYSTQPVLHGYFRDCADAFGLYDGIRFGTEVSSAVWSDEDERWTVELRGPDGDETVVVDAVISAVGQLNRPHMPEIPGLDDFAGPAFHSARWRHDVDLTGKRVAVIGTGASAMQLIPEIAPDVAELLVFQRTPAWMVPTPDYHEAVPAGLTWLYQHVPAYSEFNRFCIFWKMGDGALESVRVDPDWDQPGSVGPMNAMVQMLFTEYLKGEFADRPDLLEACTPTYPAGAKRMIRDNGVWARALKRDNVRLLTGGIRAITADGIVSADGEAHDVDVIIYGTGFTASKFLTPMTVRGRGGPRPARAVGRRGPRLPGRDGPGVPEPVLPVRPEHEHRHQRQHHLLLRVRRAVHPRPAGPGARQRPPRRRGAPRGARRVQRRGRRRERPDGLGRERRQQLVQERQRSRVPELALHPARLLAAHQGPRPRRLHPHLTAP